MQVYIGSSLLFCGVSKARCLFIVKVSSLDHKYEIRYWFLDVVVGSQAYTTGAQTHKSEKTRSGDDDASLRPLPLKKKLGMKEHDLIMYE